MTGSEHAPRGKGIQRRLFLILAAAAFVVTVASTVAILAMVDIRSAFVAVTEGDLPETTSALSLTRIGERLQSRAPALVAAWDTDERQRQARLVERDLEALSAAMERLRAVGGRHRDAVDAIAETISEVERNLRGLGALLARKSELEAARHASLDEVLVLQDRVRQILGPTLLAITDSVRRRAHPVGAERPIISDAFVTAVRAQGPILEAERLADTAINSLLVAAEALDVPTLEATRRAYRRHLDRLGTVNRDIPVRLREPMEDAVVAFDGFLDAERGLFALRRGELETLGAAGRLLAENRALADRLTEQVDALVVAANATIDAATARIGEIIVGHTLGLVGLSIAAVAVALFLSYFFVIRDLGVNLGAVTDAMSRLARGERDVDVPAMDRPDEIGDLARAFDVFRENVFRIDTLDEQLREKSQLLLATFDNMNDGFTVFDADRRLVAWNPQFVRLYGLDPEAVDVGVSIERIHDAAAEKDFAVYAPSGERVPVSRLAEGRTSSTERFEIHLPDRRIIELRSNPIPAGGFVTIHTDVTETKAIEAQLRQAQKMEVVGQLTGGIAHDFNNILAVIVGNLHLLLSGTRETPDLNDRVSRALGAADKAAMQIERLLAFSRKQKLNPEPTDANALIVGMLDLMEYSLGASVEVRTELADGLPMVLVDPGQLENALLNLAVNARDAMDRDGTITIRTGVVDGPPRAIRIDVEDTGCGMAPEVVEHVFEPFYTTKGSGQGSGLGLSMVYGFVSQSGGDIEIASAPGDGTTVSIRLPAADAERAGADVPKPDPEAPTGGDECLLVVEDDASLLEVTTAYLRGLGYCVIEATDGEAALDALRATSDIRLVFTDVVLPGALGGVRVAHAARDLRPGIEVLLTSADVSAVGEAGADLDLLQKPVAPDRLAREIRRRLDAQAFSTSASNT